MLPEQLFTSHARHGEKGLIYQGKDLLKSDPSTKSSSEVCSFLVTLTPTKTSFWPASFHMEVFH
jgi:hypothetical protein